MSDFTFLLNKILRQKLHPGQKSDFKPKLTLSSVLAKSFSRKLKWKVKWLRFKTKVKDQSLSTAAYLNVLRKFG